MKSLLTILCFLIGITGTAQVDVSTGGPTTTYTTLKAAFDAVNAGTHTGVITMAITANTTEVAQAGAASVTLNASGAGAASYTSITISPGGGGARTISGGATAGFPLINLNGSDNVTFDGLNSGGNSLTITNTMVTGTTGTCTIRFINDATNNTINRCTVRGASNMAGFRDGSTIYFSTTTGSTGNDNNTISNSDIAPVGVDLPTKAICSIGTTATAAQNNSGNIITNCNIFDYFNATTESSAILLRQGNNDWTVTNNRFYQSSSRTVTSANVVHSGIRIEGTSFDNLTISGNTIGYATSASTGTYTLVGVATTQFYPINIHSYGSTTANSIQGNTITAISFTGTMAGTNTSAPFIGIRIFEGKSNIGTTLANTIGSNAGSSAIVYTTSAATASDFSAIHYNGGIENSINNNIIGGIAVTNNSSGVLNFYGIRSRGGAAITTNIQSNQVGFWSAAITLATSTGAGLLVGILDSTGAANVTSNTVGYLDINSANPIITGIKVNNAGSTSGNNIALNTVIELTSQNAGQVYGIIYNGAATGTHQVHKNFVHSFAATAGATIYGIGISAGLVKVHNNMIRLGLNAGGDVGGGRSFFIGAPVAADLGFIGLRDNSTSNNEIYFNSIYIGGDGVTGTSNTYAFYHSDAASTRIIQNNIFFNARSNTGGTGKHYAIRVGGAGASPVGLTLNYNNYFITGTGGTLGSYNGSDVSTFGSWKSTSGAAGAGPGLDANSFFADPSFVFAMGAMPNLHVNDGGTPVEGRGINIASVTDDFDAQVRATLTPVDIGADALNAVASVLPVTFLSFSGKKVDAGNMLQWITVSESNNTGFEIQRSHDGVDFSRIGFVKTSALEGNSTSALYYSYTDTDKRNLVNFYRLRQIDLDERSSYSQVIVIKNILSGAVQIKALYPNPADGELFIQAESPEISAAVLMVTDMLGRVILKQNIRLETGYQVISVQVSHLATGRYNLHLKGTELNASIPFIKR